MLDLHHSPAWHGTWNSRFVNLNDRRLLRYLVHAVLIKLAVLTLLWFVFIRDARVAVDADAAAAQMGTAVPTQGASK